MSTIFDTYGALIATHGVIPAKAGTSVYRWRDEF
jgi:hypothetical protein